MTRELKSKLDKLEAQVQKQMGQESDQFYEFTGGEKVPVLTEAQAQARGLTQPVTLDELIRYETSPDYKLEGEYITPELLALIIETAEEAQAKKDADFQRALAELQAAVERAPVSERRKIVADFHKRYSYPHCSNQADRADCLT